MGAFGKAKLKAEVAAAEERVKSLEEKVEGIYDILGKIAKKLDAPERDEAPAPATPVSMGHKKAAPEARDRGSVVLLGLGRGGQDGIVVKPQYAKAIEDTLKNGITGLMLSASAIRDAVRSLMVSNGMRWNVRHDRDDIFFDALIRFYQLRMRKEIQKAAADATVKLGQP